MADPLSDERREFSVIFLHSAVSIAVFISCDFVRHLNFGINGDVATELSVRSRLNYSSITQRAEVEGHSCFKRTIHDLLHKFNKCKV